MNGVRLRKRARPGLLGTLRDPLFLVWRSAGTCESVAMLVVPIPYTVNANGNETARAAETFTYDQAN